jgi:amylosucrase
MYRALEHNLLFEALNRIERKYGKLDDNQGRHFITRLSENFSLLRDLFMSLYGDLHKPDKNFAELVMVLYECYRQRSRSLKATDKKREQDPNWLLSQQWVGMSLYTEHFSRDLKGLKKRLDYLQELGINLVHLMPILESPELESDGGYAVSDYRKINPALGEMSDLRDLIREFRKRGMLIALDLVLNHTSDQHIWAKKARKGNSKFQKFYHFYPDRTIPDQFEAQMPAIFPETAPGSFTYLPEHKKWVMTVFHHYQWDLNYRNPEVFTKIVKILLFLANQGVDILRLDAVPYLWKEIGTSCQNLDQAHTLVKLMKRCVQVVAPGLKFIAEAIVAPQQVIKYLGQQDQPECDIAYHATLMALIWNSLATTKVDLLYNSISKLPSKPFGTTWITYGRCHDDIGLGFDNEDIYQSGYDAKMHRAFLLDYYTGKFPGSPAKGALFMHNPITGDARISGSLASLAGLEKSTADKNVAQTVLSVKRIILVHAVMMSYGGLPVIYSGDEIGLLNNYQYLKSPEKEMDSRWMHRADMDWKSVEKRKESGSIQYRIFSALKKLIELRKSIKLWADYNNTSLVYCDNQHLLAFSRFAVEHQPVDDQNQILILMNFDSNIQLTGQEILFRQGFDMSKGVYDLYSEKPLDYSNGSIELQPYQFCFIAENPG